MKITIIIPLYKPDEYLFSKLTDYLKNYDYEILKIDGKNGLSNVYNRGIKKATGDIIVTIHQDCIPLGNNAIKELIKPFEIKEVVLTYGYTIEDETKEKYYPFVPDGKFTAYRKSALEEVGLFNETIFKYGGEDVDIFYKLMNIGKVERVNTEVLHIHPGYKTNKTIEKIKQNGSINGTLFRVYGFRYSKWVKSLVMCIIKPTSYGKEFAKSFITKKQDYRRKE